MSIYTAGIPAEYGRKMGGVVDIVTSKDSGPGLHGEAVLTGGSFATADGYLLTQYNWGKNTLGVSAQGSTTERYLNPPVLENFTNNGTTGDFGIGYERDFTNHDYLRFSVRHEFSRFLVPNEQIQEAAGQRQDRNNFETIGIASYQHLFSPSVVGDFHGMVRDDSEGLSSNPLSTPIIAFQRNSFREGYFKGTISIHHSNQEWKAGIELDSTFLREQFSDTITDLTQFDPATPPTFSFRESRPSLEQSAFVQDLIRLGNWTV